MKFSVTKNGVALDKSLYTWDEATKTFSSDQNELVLDFANIDGCTFTTGRSCTFNTGYDCTFNTGYGCTFNTGDNCVAIRYDVKGITEIPEGKTITFNGYNVAGHTIIEAPKEAPTCAGKVVEIDGKKYKLVEA